MTNYPEQRKFGDLIADGDLASAKLAADLEDLYAAPVPDLRFSPPREERVGLPGRLRWRWWRPVAAAAVAAAALVAVLIAPSPWQREPQVSAEAIFVRASTAAETNAPAAGAATYRLIATTETPGQPATLTTTETWYADASHIRTEHEYDAANSGADFGILVNGDDAWLYGAFDGVYRAAHGPASELGAGFGDLAAGAAADIGQVLGQYSDGCQVAHAEGEETIAARAAYKIVVAADTNACPALDANRGPGKLGVLTVWVDQETFLPLKTEQQDATGSVMYVYEVTQIDVGGAIPESTFVYLAPAGTAVQDVTNLTEAKFVLSGYTLEGAPAQ